MGEGGREGSRADGCQDQTKLAKVGLITTITVKHNFKLKSFIISMFSVKTQSTIDYQ